MSEVTITVSGPCGSGKSALLGEIEIMCKALSIPVRYSDENRAQADKNMNGADFTSELEMYKPSVVLVEDMPWLRTSAAPVSGQGASIDTPEFRNLLQDHRVQPNSEAKLNRLIAYIDSRPRSEYSRAKVAPPAEWRDVIAQARDSICAGGLAEYVQHERSIVEPHLDGIYDELEALENEALASTPPKADNE